MATSAEVGIKPESDDDVMEIAELSPAFSICVVNLRFLLGDLRVDRTYWFGLTS